ncbi:putative leucine-rich repeat receptor-like protein kinase [Hibiscus syriacus]|uniref:Leucine-rich repeat receptor-like protein kinase n=1 Tax=Hibiscus syriacus TaxID=106335 RepID=A0A6A3ACU7_HIBSY|nr:putative leucine-rich repeat receptor-like protein kinase [Hibiscus syriacus]
MCSVTRMSSSRYCFLCSSLLILSFAVLAILIRAQDISGFISLDCGLSAGSSNTDPRTGIPYISDAPYIQTGLTRRVLPEFRDGLPVRYWTVRSFPEGDRNCYNFTLRKGDVYLIRAGFIYGNYDGENMVPKFDIYVGPHFWDTIDLRTADNSFFYDIFHVLQSDYLYVCLVNTGNGVPCISFLQLIPIDNTTYPTLSQTESLDHYARYDVGLSSSEDSINTLTGFPKTFSIDIGILITACTPVNGSQPMDIYMSSSSTDASYYVYMHFAEVEELQANESREFSIYHNGDIWYGPFSPMYLNTTTIYSTSSLKDLNFTIERTSGSTLPPILNAFEIFEVKDFSQPQTNEKDVDAMVNIQSMYGLKRNWQGDPCLPKKFLWEGLNCSYDETNPPRVISLNLSSSNLNGEIPNAIANLTQLQYLDLSNNRLTGPVAEFLANLQFLTLLNLSRNMLNGSIPAGLTERVNQGQLDLIMDENASPICISGSCSNDGDDNNNNTVVPVVASVASVALVLVIVWAALWNIRRRARKHAEDWCRFQKNKSVTGFVKEPTVHACTGQKATNNFGTVVGKGGFGTVYHGYLDETQVAVKMLSPFSAQGYQQFQAEVELLLRVHHRNLTTLIGYCDDGNNMGLIYEYMAKGNLAEHLKDSSRGILNWEARLGIALEAAQGLEYLHHGCTPPIIHRDVKSTNILLTESLHAKLSDFGLSKAFPLEGDSHVITVVAGTPGYVDPEYSTSNRLTEKSDVYSFGVVLLEIITNRPVTTKTYNQTTHISQWVSLMLSSDDINTIADSRLQGDFDISSMKKAVELAMACVSPTSTRRPTMTYVVTELNECLSAEIDRNHNIQLAPTQLNIPSPNAR